MVDLKKKKKTLKKEKKNNDWIYYKKMRGVQKIGKTIEPAFMT